MDEQLTIFDYKQLDLDTKVELQIDESKLDLHFNSAGIHLYEAGKILAKWRDKLRHNKAGGFEGWLRQRYPSINKMSAYRLIDVAVNFNCNNLLQLDSMAKSALYLLASPSTPEPAREEALDRASQGEQITHATAKEIAEKLPTVGSRETQDYSFHGKILVSTHIYDLRLYLSQKSIIAFMNVNQPKV